MKFNIAYPSTGHQKVVEIDDPKKLASLNDKRMSQEVEGDSLGDEFKGYVFRITGGNDKQGFAMKQGVLVPHRVRLLLKKGMSCYRERRKGERHRRSVRGCIVGPDIAVLNLIVVKKGDNELPGLTDSVLPLRLGPKRASKIRKLFALTKEDDVKSAIADLRRTVPAKKEGKKAISKAPKIQRLVTPERLRRKRHFITLKKQRAAKTKADAAEYQRLLKKIAAEQRAKRHSQVSKIRSERASTKESGDAKAKDAKKVDAKKADTKKVDAKKADPKKVDAKKADAKSAAKPAAPAAAKPAAAKPAAKAAAPAAAAAKPATAAPAAAKPAAAAAKPAAAAPAAAKPAAAKPAVKPAGPATSTPSQAPKTASPKTAAPAKK